MSNLTKKQHYVPQFLLKNWSHGKTNRVYVFDKKHNKSFSSSTKNIAHENNFYENGELGQENKTEIKLSNLECGVAPIISEIISDGSIKKLSDSEHKLLCLFSAVQMLRTNNSREFIEGLNDIISEKIQDWGFDPDTDVENFTTMSKEEVKNSSISMLNSMPIELVDNFIDKELTLLKAPDNSSFYISDHPIVKHNHFPREYRGNLGIGLYGIEIYFPISPQYCLSFLCSEVANEVKQGVKKHRAEKVLGLAKQYDISEAELMVESFENKTPYEVSLDNMDFNNSLQVISSTRFVYSTSEEFSLAFDMLKSNPEISTQPKVVDGSKIF